MGNVIRENIAPLNDKLTVTISKDDYLPAFEKSLKEYAKKANIPGFRKGLVPTGVVKKMYGQSVFTEEIYKSLERQLTEYLTAEQIDYLGQPLPLNDDVKLHLDVNAPGDYSFNFEIGLKPSVNIDFSNIHVTRYKPEITDQMIDEEVARLQTRYGTVLDQETVDNDENMLTLQFTETDAEENIIENGVSKIATLLVKYFTEATRKEWMGKKANDSQNIQLSSALEEKEREWVMSDLGLDKNNSTAADKFFKLTITKVGLMQKAALDSAFFDKVYAGKNITTPEEFRAEVLAEVENYYRSQSSGQVQDQIYHHLLDDIDIPLPEKFLRHWLQIETEKNKPGEDVEQDLPKFKKQLKWSLISSKLLEDNKVTVEQSEIKDAAKRQLFNYMGGQQIDEASWMDEYADRMLNDKKFVEETYLELKTAKLFSLLENMVHETEERISVEDFATKLHHHHH